MAPNQSQDNLVISLILPNLLSPTTLTIRNQPRSIPRLRTPSHNDRFSIPNSVLRSGDGWSKDTEIVDRIEGEETRVGGLIDG